MFIQFKFDGQTTLIEVTKHPADFSAESVEDATSSYIDNVMEQDTPYEEIVSDVMSSFKDIVWHEVVPYEINI